MATLPSSAENSYEEIIEDEDENIRETGGYDEYTHAQSPPKSLWISIPPVTRALTDYTESKMSQELPRVDIVRRGGETNGKGIGGSDFKYFTNEGQASMTSLELKNNKLHHLRADLASSLTVGTEAFRKSIYKGNNDSQSNGKISQNFATSPPASQNRLSALFSPVFSPRPYSKSGSSKKINNKNSIRLSSSKYHNFRKATLHTDTNLNYQIKGANLLADPISFSKGDHPSSRGRSNKFIKPSVNHYTILLHNRAKPEPYEISPGDTISFNPHAKSEQIVAKNPLWLGHRTTLDQMLSTGNNYSHRSPRQDPVKEPLVSMRARMNTKASPFSIGKGDTARNGKVDMAAPVDPLKQFSLFRITPHK